ncbi:hypothetical protein Gotri_016569 [Gossypium trilobum]|uniref:RRM domain-containing protein n=1 Tax=Gossypium trilobum TaxID=34281 RepID=A0A7J9E3W6_9ROSI|nr:hypothetical protein [Gossypium trilobum]
MRDKVTGRPRGFGFVVFSDPSIINTVLQENFTANPPFFCESRSLLWLFCPWRLQRQLLLSHWAFFSSSPALL